MFVSVHQVYGFDTVAKKFTVFNVQVAGNINYCQPCTGNRQLYYSLLKLFTGFIKAAFMAW